MAVQLLTTPNSIGLYCDSIVVLNETADAAVINGGLQVAGDTFLEGPTIIAAGANIETVDLYVSGELIAAEINGPALTHPSTVMTFDDATTFVDPSGYTATRCGITGAGGLVTMAWDSLQDAAAPGDGVTIPAAGSSITYASSPTDPLEAAFCPARSTSFMVPYTISGGPVALGMLVIAPTPSVALGTWSAVWSSAYDPTTPLPSVVPFVTGAAFIGTAAISYEAAPIPPPLLERIRCARAARKELARRDELARHAEKPATPAAAPGNVAPAAP